MAQLLRVRLLRGYKQFNGGECCAFPPREAMRLVEDHAAVLLDAPPDESMRPGGNGSLPDGRESEQAPDGGASVGGTAESVTGTQPTEDATPKKKRGRPAAASKTPATAPKQPPASKRRTPPRTKG